MSQTLLTPAQRKALVHAVSDQATTPGVIFPGNGFSLPTVRRLEALGYVAVEATVSYRGNSRGRTVADLDWTARLTEDGLTLAGILAAVRAL